MTDASLPDGSSPGSEEACGGRMCSLLDGPCGTGHCDEHTNTCVFEMAPNGTACSDENGCTTGDACMNGACVSTGQVDCSALDDVCVMGTCDPETVMCQVMPVLDGVDCDDADPCTQMDHCAGGTCGGAPLDCSAMTDMCNTGACDPMNGTCAAIPLADGTLCDDGDPETGEDQCNVGVCEGVRPCRWLLVSEGTELADPAIRTLLTSHGFEFFVITNNGRAGMYTSDATFLSGYTHMIFHHEDRAITARENEVLSDWLNAGGSMIATGYDTIGSPTDSQFASLMGCSSPGDGPFSGALSVVDAAHPITMGPYQTFTTTMSLTASSNDHDRCTPTHDARRLLSLSSGSAVSSKLQIRTDIGPGGGTSVYWNGNGSSSGGVPDWTGTGMGTQPDLQNLLLNTMQHLCETR